jgi:hypothetical protein
MRFRSDLSPSPNIFFAYNLTISFLCLLFFFSSFFFFFISFLLCFHFGVLSTHATVHPKQLRKNQRNLFKKAFEDKKTTMKTFVWIAFCSYFSEKLFKTLNECKFYVGFNLLISIISVKMECRNKETKIFRE